MNLLVYLKAYEPYKEISLLVMICGALGMTRIGMGLVIWGCVKVNLKVALMNDQSFIILMMLLSLVISLLVFWVVMVALKKAGYKKEADKESDKEAERQKKIDAITGVSRNDKHDPNS